MAANEATIELTFTATEAGTVTVEFTKMGYMGSLGLSDKPIAECFAGANGTTIWFNAYIDGVQLNSLYKGSVEVEAGQTITIKLDHVGGTYFLSKVREGVVNIGFVAGSSEGGDVDEPVEGEIFNVETTDTYCYADKYTFVAPAAGEYTFYIPAGLGLTTPDRDANWQQPIIDFYDNADGYTYVIDLYAGQEFEVMVGALEKAQWEIVYTYVEKDVEGPSEPDTPVEPPVVDAPSVELGETTIDADTLYTYSATADGTLKIDVSSGSMQYGAFQGTVYNYGALALEINGVEVTTAQGIYEMEVTAGQTVTIMVVVKNQMYVGAKINLKLAQEAPAEPTNDVILGTTVIDGDVLYTFTATEAGTLIINAASGTMQYGAFQGTVYNYGTLALEINGVEVTTAQGIYEMEVTAGQVVTIKVAIKNAMYAGAKINLVLEMAAPAAPELGLGSNTADGDVEYIFNVTESGKLTIDASTGNLNYYGSASVYQGSFYQYNNLKLYVNGNLVDGANKGVIEIDVTAGTTVTIKVEAANANITNLKPTVVLTLATGSDVEGPGSDVDGPGSDVDGPGSDVDGPGSDVDQPGDNDEPAAGTGTGTSGDPFIVGELPYEATHASSTDDKYYKWTATVAGVLTLEKTDGLATMNGSSMGAMTEDGSNKVLKVAAGDTIIINYWGGTGFTLTFSEGIEIKPGDTAEKPIELEAGAALELTLADSGVYYAWIAPEAGKFIVTIKSSTFNFGYSLTVNGQSMGYGVNELVLDVQAGDKILVEFKGEPNASDTWKITMIGELDDGSCKHEYVDGVCTKCGEVKEPDGTTEYPFIIGNQNATYAYEGTPVWFKYAPDVDTTLIIKTDKTKYHSMGMVSVNGVTITTPSKVDTDSYYVYTVEVKAGTVLKFRINAMFSAASEMIVEVQQQLPCQHTNTAERNENVVNATCQAGGSYDKVTYCAGCQEVISTEKITTGALAHTHAERTENTVDATCTAGGSYDKVTYCSVCGTVVSTEHFTTDALEHTYENGTCTGCGAEDPNYVPEQPEQPGDNENPGTGSMDMMAIVLIAMMSVVAIVSVSTKKAYKA